MTNEVGGPRGLPPGSSPRLKRPHHVGEADGVDVEDGLGVGVGSLRGGIAGDEDQVPDPRRRRPQEVADHPGHAAAT